MQRRGVAEDKPFIGSPRDTRHLSIQEGGEGSCGVKVKGVIVDKYSHGRRPWDAACSAIDDRVCVGGGDAEKSQAPSLRVFCAGWVASPAYCATLTTPERMVAAAAA